MAGPRTLAALQPRTEEEIEFDREAEQQSEAEVVNVSPYTARFEVATVPGSKPRRYKLEPGERVFLQHGYTVEFMGQGRQPVRPTIESNTEREAWPGLREEDKDGRLVWKRRPGPRLPMVVHVDRAAAVKAMWDAAMAQLEELDHAPLRMTLTRSDGREVEVEAEVSRPMPVDRPAQRAAVEDIEDLTQTVLDEPPPDHDDPLPVELPPAPAAIPTRARGGKGRGE